MKLTAFQRRVLAIVRAIGPADLDQIAEHIKRPRRAIRRALYRLRVVSLVARVDDDRHDITMAGLDHLKKQIATNRPGYKSCIQKF